MLNFKTKAQYCLSLCHFVNVCLLRFLHQCTCWPGFRLKNDGRTCIDVDECSESFPCSHQCINTYGSFRCLCADGYQRTAGNPQSCRSLSGTAGVFGRTGANNLPWTLAKILPPTASLRLIFRRK